MRRIVAMLALTLCASGCAIGPDAGEAIDPREATARPRIQVTDPIIRGGSFVEGHVTFVSSEDVPAWTPPLEYEDTVEATVDPGSWEVLVRVVPCTASCPTWKQLAATIRAQRRRNDGRSALQDQILECRSGVDLERGDVAVFEPIVELAGEVRTCLLDGRVVSTRIR